MEQLSNNEIFYNDGYNLVKSEMNGKSAHDSLFLALKKMYQSVDLLIDSLLNMAKKQGINIGCHKGCEWCCHQAVFANSYEIHYLSDYIKKKFPKAEKERVHDAARSKNAKVSSLSEDEILKYKSPCALLVNGACTAYEARPMACRIYLSTRLETCLEYYHHPENNSNYPALLDFPLQAGKMMNEGFMAALLEQDIATAEFRLEDGLSIALNDGWSEPNA